MPVFRGTFGVANGRNAVRVTDVIRRTAPLKLAIGPARDQSPHRRRAGIAARQFSEPAATTNAMRGADSEQGLDVILDVSVTLSMEVGRARIPIRNLLQLNPGSVVELERAAGEPLDIYVNGTLIAHGEVVVINDRFGVRLTDVVSPTERIRRLR
jgi:flagellar motor switch protein FliN/FliY